MVFQFDLCTPGFKICTSTFSLCACVCVCVRVRVCVCVRVCMCMCMFICIFTCVYLCECLHVFTSCVCCVMLVSYVLRSHALVIANKIKSVEFNVSLEFPPSSIPGLCVCVSML